MLTVLYSKQGLSQNNKYLEIYEDNVYLLKDYYFIFETNTVRNLLHLLTLLDYVLRSEITYCTSRG